MERQTSSPMVQAGPDCRRWRFVSVPEQHTPPRWRRLAQEFWEAATAWRTELDGRRYYRGAIDFASWKRLRDGQPRHWEQFDAARSRLMLEPTNQLDAIRAKLDLFADMFGLGDLRMVACLGEPAQDPATLYLAAIVADMRRASDAAEKVVTPGWRLRRRSGRR